MASKGSRIGWAAIVISFLVFPSLFYADYHFSSKSSPGVVRLSHKLQARDQTVFNGPSRHGPGHQNPIRAPNDGFGGLTATAASASGGLTPNVRTLARRGPLRCDNAESNGKCIDGSCCNNDGICGYGPTYCGQGNCSSGCDATAMCGVYSEDDGDMPCGMNLCCSAMGWCGTTDDYCTNADPARGSLPCQAGYGSCQTYPTPSCGLGTGSTKGRTIGYYQSWNIRERACNQVSPHQLNTTGYTHLYYAFASIHPEKFVVEAAHVDDLTMMKEFSLLAKGGLQTWIAVGGFDFSDNNTNTHTTWSDMVSSPGNRAAFIQSAKAYMDQWGFQGIDLDWEYPGAPERGGKKLADTRNLSLLLKEMRAAFGKNYGISVTLAPDYWYLRWFDAKAMEPYVDWFGFMAYDLHGSWDSDTKTLGEIVRGQADIREISNDTTPLWFDGLDPQKINFGLAMYGRGYTLADPSCNQLGCHFSNASTPAPCTQFAGVMSLLEIQQLIQHRGLTPQYLPEAMMKQIAWDDQWIGYDDEETHAAKRMWADNLCFGGTMVWSIDFQVEGSGGPNDTAGDVIYLASPIYSGIPAQCTPPCQLVLPPIDLSTTTTLSIPPFTASLEVIPGVTTTTVLSVSPITTNSMQFYNVNVTLSQSSGSFRATASIDVPPVVVTITVSQTITQTRTLFLPPWPAITRGSSTQRNTSTDGGGWLTRTKLPHKTGPVPPPTHSPKPTAKPTTTTTSPLSSRTWPSDFLIPVPTEVSDDDKDKKKSPCRRIWFIVICIKLDDFSINGWEWNLPDGLYGPGPPPLDKIKLPPEVHIQGNLPDWPQITISNGGVPTIPPQPADCTPQTAEICKTTSSFATTVDGGSTKTTATQVTSACATITGCKAKDVDATTSVNVCTLRHAGVQAAALPEMTEAAEGPVLHKRIEPDWSSEKDGPDGIIWPTEYGAASQERIRQLLRDRDAALDSCEPKLRNGWYESRSDDLDFTAFYYVNNMGPEAKQFFSFYEGTILRAYDFQQDSDARKGGHPENAIWKRENEAFNYSVEEDIIHRAEPTSTNNTDATRVRPAKRAVTSSVGDKWHLSQLSVPEGVDWNEDDPGDGPHKPSQEKYAYYFDNNLGSGQTIYLMEAGLEFGISELDGHPRDVLERANFGRSFTPTDSQIAHGSIAASFAVGKTVGVARNAVLVHVPVIVSEPTGWPRYEIVLDGLIRIANDIAQRNLPKNTAVVNMSFHFNKNGAHPEFWTILIDLMRTMEERHGIIFVTSAGNTGRTETWAYPNLASEYMAGMLVVGATDKTTLAWAESDRGDVNIWAPGVDLPVPLGIVGQPGVPLSGTSLASPMVAGLVAYLRGHPTLGFPKDPLGFFNAFIDLQRPISVSEEGDDPNAPAIVWNSQDKDQTCPAIEQTQKRDDASTLLDRRADTCPVPGSGSGNGLLSPVVTFVPGPPGPLCQSHCGHHCSGYYCVPNPTGEPPGFFAPTESPSKTTTTPPPPPPTSFIDCEYIGPDPDANRPSAFCSCSGSTFPLSTATYVTPFQSCAYTTLPTVTTDVSPPEMTITDAPHCKVCTYEGQFAQCGSIPGCTPAPSSTPPPTGGHDTWDVGFYNDQCKKAVSYNGSKDGTGSGYLPCSSVDGADCITGSTNQFGKMHMCAYMTTDCTAKDRNHLADIGPMGGPDNGQSPIFVDGKFQLIHSWKVVLGDCPLS